MKRVIFIFCVAAFAATCVAADMPQSATDLGCTNCHAIDHASIGPSWLDIARRYQDKRSDPGVVKQLVKNVSNGSQDAWGSLPMVANDPGGKRRNQIVDVVNYILSLGGSSPENKGK